jgi:hypothetical protein
MSSVGPDCSEFRNKFQIDLDFQKIKKILISPNKFLRLIIEYLKRNTLQASFSRLSSVVLYCAHFWNQGQADIFYH